MCKKWYNDAQRAFLGSIEALGSLAHSEFGQAQHAETDLDQQKQSRKKDHKVYSDVGYQRRASYVKRQATPRPGAQCITQV